MDDLLNRLEKSAGFGSGLFKGVGNYLKNVSGYGVRSLEKEQAKTSMNSNRWTQLPTEIHNAKVDRNIARVGTGAVGLAAGAGLGGYKAYEQSKEEPLDTDLYEQNQFTQNNLQPKIASELMERLEKTAKEMKPEMGVEELLTRLQKTAEAIEDPEENLYQAHPFNSLQGAPEEQPPSEMYPLMDQGGEVINEHVPYSGATIGGTGGASMEDLQNVPQENSRQGAGSVSNAPAGVDKTAEDLISRLEKTAGQENPVQAPSFDSDLSAAIEKSAEEIIAKLEKKAEEEQQQEPQHKGPQHQSPQHEGPQHQSPQHEGPQHQSPQHEGPQHQGQQHEGSQHEGQQQMRQNRSFPREAFMGAGPVGYFAKKNNKLGVHPEDSHAQANGKIGAMSHGISSGLFGAGVAGALEPQGEKLLGAAKIGIPMAALGAISGYLEGHRIGEMYDEQDQENAANQIQPPAEEIIGGFKQASENDDLMSRLEKTAGIPGLGAVAGLAKGVASKVGSGVAGFAHNAMGKDLSYAAQGIGHAAPGENALMSVPKYNPTPEATHTARTQLGVGAGLAGAGGIGYGMGVHDGQQKTAAEAVPSEEKSIVAKSQKELQSFMNAVEKKDGVKAEEKPENQSKVASEEDDMLNGLFKEAASVIMDMHFPEIREHVDPMSRITFSK